MGNVKDMIWFCSYIILDSSSMIETIFKILKYTIVNNINV